MNIREMYSILTQMPLLQGLNGLDLARMEERLNIRIIRIDASVTPFIQQGDICNELVFLTQGTLTKETISPDGRYITTEEIETPAVIEPEQLYGLTCKYTSSYSPKTSCQFFKVKKANVNSHLMHLEIFRINYMNMLSSLIHKSKEQNTYRYGQDAREKLTTFLRSLFQYTDGEKKIQVKMTDIAEYIGETRLTVSGILNDMSKEGLLQLKRMGIIIPDIKSLR